MPIRRSGSASPRSATPGGNELRQSQELQEGTDGLQAGFERLTLRHRSRVDAATGRAFYHDNVVDLIGDRLAGA